MNDNHEPAPSILTLRSIMAGMPTLKERAVLALNRISNAFVFHGYGPVTAEQRECIFNPARSEEALAMVDHWIVRCDARMDDADDISHYIAHREGDFT